MKDSVRCPLCSTTIVGAQHICLVASRSILRRRGTSSCGSSSVGSLSVTFSEASDDVMLFDRMEGMDAVNLRVGERVRTAAALAGASKQEVEEGTTGRVIRVYPCGLIEVKTDGAVTCYAEPSDLTSLGFLQPKQKVLTTVPLLLSSASLQLTMPSSSPAVITSVGASSISIQFETGPRCEIAPTNVVPCGPLVAEPREKKAKISLKERLAGVVARIAK